MQKNDASENDSAVDTGGPRIVLMLGQTETALFEKPH